jgi:TolB-like protein/class 3 adenylate cyclase
MSESTQRRLTAIVAIDVVGYSRLMGIDEVGTLRRLNAHRSELIDPLISQHGGRIVKTTGDGLLLEYPSVVAAVECCISVQKGMIERNADAGDDVIRFRIGVHLGDVIVEGDDIFGDGVNIAARLQEIGEADGITLSRTTHENVAGRISANFEDGGEQELKNIAAPVHVWRWSTDEIPSVSTTEEKPLPLPDKPSIAVLPFDNMSGDPEQAYFADGIAEDIITALSRVGWLFVIARNSSFAFKGRNAETADIGRKLGVRYLLEGSVRKADNRVRITAQLVEATAGNHLWAERFDGTLDDIFELQDSITESVVGAIEPKLRKSEIARARRKRPENLDAYDWLLRSLPYIAAFTRQDLDSAKTFLDNAIALDPSYGEALARAAWTHAIKPAFGWSEAPEDDLRRALEYAQRALRAEPENPIALAYSAYATVLVRRDYETGANLVEKSLAIDPNAAMCWGISGLINVWSGQNEAAVSDFNRAMRLSPFDSWSFVYLNNKAVALITSGYLEEGLLTAKKALQENPDFIATYRTLVAAHGELGQSEAARAFARRHQELEPAFTVGDWVMASPIRQTPAQERFVAALLEAGLPA